MRKWIIWYTPKNGLYTKKIEVEADTRPMAMKIFNKIKPLSRNQLRDIYLSQNQTS